MSVQARFRIAGAYAAASWIALLQATAGGDAVLLVLLLVQAALLLAAGRLLRNQSRPRFLASFGLQFASYLLSGAATLPALIAPCHAAGASAPPRREVVPPVPAPPIPEFDRLVAIAESKLDPDDALAGWKQARLAAGSAPELVRAKKAMDALAHAATERELSRGYTLALREAETAQAYGQIDLAARKYREALGYRDGTRAWRGLEELMKVRSQSRR